MKNFIKQTRSLLLKIWHLMPNKEWLGKNRFKILIVVIIISGFYWFFLRPEIIEKNCSKQTIDWIRRQVNYISDENAAYRNGILICKNQRIFY